MSKNVEELFLKQDKNCAEAVMIGVCDEMNIDIDENTVKALSAFGGGCAVGSFCGAAAAGVGVLGIIYNTGNAHKSPDLKKATAMFVNDFTEMFGSTMCSELTPKYKKEDVRCLEIVEKISTLIRGIIAKI